MDQEILQRRYDLRVVHAQLLQTISLGRRHKEGSERRRNRLAQAQVIVRIIDAKRRLDDRNLDVNLDSRRGVRPELGARSDRQIVRYVHARSANRLAREIRIRILLPQGTNGRGIELQLRFPQNSIHREIVEQAQSHVGFHKRDAVFQVRHELQIAARDAWV